MNEYYKFIHQKFCHAFDMREDRQKQVPKNLSSMTKAEMEENIKRFIEEKICPTIFTTE